MVDSFTKVKYFEVYIGLKIAKEAPKKPLSYVCRWLFNFLEATKRAAKTIRDSLKNYEKVSGHLINLQKFQIQFYKGSEKGLKGEITQIFYINNSIA